MTKHMHQTRPPFLELDFCRLVQLVWPGSLSNNSNKAQCGPKVQCSWGAEPISEVWISIWVQNCCGHYCFILFCCLVSFLISCCARLPYLPCHVQRFGAGSCHSNGICNILEFESSCLEGFGTPTVHVASSLQLLGTSRVHLGVA